MLTDWCAFTNQVPCHKTCLTLCCCLCVGLVAIHRHIPIIDVWTIADKCVWRLEEFVVHWLWWQVFIWSVVCISWFSWRLCRPPDETHIVVGTSLNDYCVAFRASPAVRKSVGAWLNPVDMKHTDETHHMSRTLIGPWAGAHIHYGWTYVHQRQSIGDR